MVLSKRKTESAGKMSKGLGIALFLCLLARGSLCFAATPACVSITPASGVSNPDKSVTFTANYTDASGYADISSAYFLANTNTTTANCFYAHYNRTAHKLYFYDSTNATWIGGFAPGNSTTLKNSYAQLNCASTSVTATNTTLSVKWSVTFRSTFGGTKSTYLSARNNAGVSTGFVPKGTWRINNKPTVISVSPSSGKTLPNKLLYFTSVHRDIDGVVDINHVSFLINSSNSAKYAPHVTYDPNKNLLYLHVDNDSSWGQGAAPGSSVILENSYAKLDCSKTTISRTSTDITVTWALIIKPTVVGKKNLYIFIKDNYGLYTSFSSKGSYCFLREPIPLPE